MSQVSRREFGQFALGAALAGRAVFAAPKVNSKVKGVRIGVQSYSFRDRSLDEAIKAMKEIGLGVCELYQGHLEPRDADRGALRKWRLETPLDEFRKAGRKFKDAGIELYAYNYSFRDDFTDEEIARGFQMAQALGAKRSEERRVGKECRL